MEFKTVEEFCADNRCWDPDGPSHKKIIADIKRLVDKFKTPAAIDGATYGRPWQFVEDMLPGIHDGHTNNSWNYTVKQARGYARHLQPEPQKVTSDNSWYRPFVDEWTGRTR